ncbi:YesL family protein [Cellulosilyticum sp. I15G10I2]|uniref:YesL family protein n=1 Tax=Cellulosilyticum sp. I15G10I2 TaxID=1892843 RepID=UPI00085C9159|nr:YesL family protein [Cellulosilyticum sp. I15G10I2]
MSNFFDLDAPIWAWMTELADIMMLSIYWWVCSIPVITVGASTTSLFYVLGKKARKEPVYITRDYFKSFKENFKQSIPVSILLIIAWVSAALYGMLGLEIALSGNMAGMMKIIFPLAVVFIFETIHISIYVCAVFSRFNMKVYHIFTTAFILVHKHLLTTLIHTVIIVIGVGLFLKLPFLILILPAAIVGAVSYFIQPIFTKYIEQQTPVAEILSEE